MLASAADFALINNKEEKTFKRLFLAAKHARYSPNGKISFFCEEVHVFAFKLFFFSSFLFFSPFICGDGRVICM